MKDKIELALRRAAEQLPQPDFQVVAETPVQPLEVHDYITRQMTPVRARPRWPAAVALVLCALVLCAGLWTYFQYFQIYSVVDLRVNPGFAIELNRQDQVRGIQALNAEAQEILEGRSYKGWTLDSTVEALVDELTAKGYLDTSDDTVDVAVNSKDADHGRALREEVESLIALKLSGLPAGEETTSVSGSPAPSSTTPAQPSDVVDTPPPSTPAPSTPAPSTQTPNTPAASSPPPAIGSNQEMLTWDEAKAIVTARMPEATFKEIKIDDDDGRMIYELKFWDSQWIEYEAELDAYTGQVLKWERD